MSTTRSSKYRSRKSLPAAESHCLHPVLRFPSLNSERCRSSLDRRTDGNCFIVGEFVRRPVAARRRTRRTRPLIVTGNGRYPPKVRFWAEGNRSKKNPHPVPPSRRTTSRAGSQTEAENLGMIMPPRGHRLRPLDYVPQKETIFSGLLALSLLVMPSKALGWRMVLANQKNTRSHSCRPPNCYAVFLASVQM